MEETIKQANSFTLKLCFRDFHMWAEIEYDDGSKGWHGSDVPMWIAHIRYQGHEELEDADKIEQWEAEDFGDAVMSAIQGMVEHAEMRNS